MVAWVRRGAGGSDWGLWQEETDANRRANVWWDGRYRFGERAWNCEYALQNGRDRTADRRHCCGCLVVVNEGCVGWVRQAISQRRSGRGGAWLLV
jgi:hypothetical protein